MIQRAQSKDAIKQFDRLDLGQDALMAFGPGRETRLQSRSLKSQDRADRSAAETVKKAIDSTIGKRVHDLQVLIEDDCVIVEATAPSFYIRQLVEHESRSIVVENVGKRFVSRVAVKN